MGKEDTGKRWTGTKPEKQRNNKRNVCLKNGHNAAKFLVN